MLEVHILDYLFLIAMRALLYADLLAQACDLYVDALGSPI